MPIYEYHCSRCKKDVSIFFLSFSEAENEEAHCPECGNKELARVFSSVSVIKGNSNSQGSKASNNSAKEDDTRSLAAAMDKAVCESGADYGDDFKEVKSRLEKGESANSIEKSLRKRVGESMQTH
ncbi:MAG: zinc ribbon domain-containing protein [Deltaproteobacteria bacterium]